MKQKEIDAIAAIVVRLFDKETSVCDAKFSKLAELSAKYKIRACDVQKARSSMLEESVAVLVKNPMITKDLVIDLIDLAKSDSQFTSDEFLLLRSLEYSLGGKGQIITIPVQKLQINGRVAMFVQFRKDGFEAKQRKKERAISRSETELSQFFSSYGIEFLLVSRLVADYADESRCQKLKDFSYYLSHFDHEYICQAIDDFSRFDSCQLGDIIRALHPSNIAPGSYFLIKMGSSFLSSYDDVHPLQVCHNFVLLPIRENDSLGVIKLFFTGCKVNSPMIASPSSQIPHFDLYKSIIACQLIMGTGKIDTDITICPYDRVVIFDDVKDAKGCPRIAKMGVRIVEYLFVMWQTLYIDALQRLEHEYAIMVLNYIVKKLSQGSASKEKPYLAVKDGAKWLKDNLPGKTDFLCSFDFHRSAGKVDQKLDDIVCHTPIPDRYKTMAVPNKDGFSSPHNYRIGDIPKKVYIATTQGRTILLQNKNYHAAVIDILKSKVELKGSVWGEEMYEFAKESNE